MSDSVWPHRWQPTRLCHPWDSPGKNTGVCCHFLLQCMNVKSKSEVTQSCLSVRNPVDWSLPGSSVHGVFQARVLEWVAIAFSESSILQEKKKKEWQRLASGSWNHSFFLFLLPTSYTTLPSLLWTVMAQWLSSGQCNMATPLQVCTIKFSLLLILYSLSLSSSYIEKALRIWRRVWKEAGSLSPCLAGSPSGRQRLLGLLPFCMSWEQRY